MKLMVLDGNSIVNRAFYGLSQNLTTRSGQPTNAVLGFLNILNKLLDECQPEGLCVAFDRKAPTFRHLAYEGYKATRKGMPDELASQLPILKDVLSAMGIPMYELDGWEADDLIGTISVKDAAAGWETVIVTGDKDSLQLVTDSTTVKLVSTRMGRTTSKDMTPEVFRAEYGFDPIHIIDLKALMGDASDNIPGVKGVGEKTAMALIQRYGSIEQLYAAMPQPEMAPGVPAKPGVVKKLSEGEEMARMSYDLATIHCDAPIQLDPRDNLRREPDGPRLYQLFVELEFSKLIDKYHLTAPQGQGAPREEEVTCTCTSEVVCDPQRAQALLEEWGRADHVAVLTLPGLEGVCVSYCPTPAEGRGALLFPNRLEGYDRVLGQLFGPGVRKVVHGSKELWKELLDQGIEPGDMIFDTQVAAYLLAPTDGSYDLEKLGLTYYSHEFPKAKTYLEPGAFDSLFAFETAVSAGKDPYAGAEDREGSAAQVSGPMGAMLSHCALIDSLYETLSRRLEELGLAELYRTVELPLCPVLAEMEREGVLVDRKALTAFGETLAKGIQADQEAIYQAAGEEFNINSTQQLGHILFDKLGLPPVKKTKTGYSTSAEVLDKLRGRHPVIDVILDYRQLTKLKSTYVEGLTKVIAPDGRIHTCFQNTVTATGRLSSTEPNLQNIPIRTPLGAQMRTMFVAGPGNVLVDADYSQIELRLLAHMSKDERMIQAFLDGRDFHTLTAAQVFGVEPGAVTHEMRRSAKAVNFGIVYGISPFSLSQDIGVTVAQAKEYMDRYFATYPGVRAYMDGVVERAREEGYVSTLMGRRRWLPELKSSNFNTRSFGERVALNMPIQGTAADIIKIAMVRVRDRLLADGLRGRLVLQVHDELIVECPREEGERVCALVKEEMEGAARLSVPLVADTAQGSSWADAH